MSDIDFNQFKCAGAKVALGSFKTDYDSGLGEDELKELRRDLLKDVADLQSKLYAESKQSLLIVLQAMDAAGKDSSIDRLTSRLNVQGCHVHSFKKPSKIELAHDFLWRIHQVAPQAGHMTIFNRSHYEDVLIVKVHGWASEGIIERRYEHINNFESMLADRGTKVLKFMLNISPDYQLERFRRRLEVPGKHWKFNPGDLDERRHWDEYMEAFEVVMEKCASEQAPWYIVPAENRPFRDVMLASVIKQTLEEMEPEYPEAEFDESVYTAESLDELL